MMPTPFNQNTLIFLACATFGLSLGRSFRDLDNFIKKKIPNDFKDTFTYYIISGVLRAVHHYMIGLIIMAFNYPPSGKISLAFFSFGLGLTLDEIDLLIKDIRRITNAIRKLRSIRGDRSNA